MRQIMEKSGGVEAQKGAERKRESLITYFSKAINMSTVVSRKRSLVWTHMLKEELLVCVCVRESQEEGR